MNAKKYIKIRDKILDEMVPELASSRFYSSEVLPVIDKFSDALKPREISQLICYGLGSFSSGLEVASRYQLALLILVHRHFQSHGTSCSQVIKIFDPSFNDTDIKTLLSFRVPQFETLQENEQCAHSLSAPTKDDDCVLFYMPHLDKFLYDNLLGVNWMPKNLSRLAVLGNSFKEMIETEISLKARSKLYYLNLVASNFERSSSTNKKQRPKKVSNLNSTDGLEALVEYTLNDSSFEHSNIFNSLSLHCINLEWLDKNYSMINHTRRTDWSPQTCDHIGDY